jgi:hypothetical protein
LECGRRFGAGSLTFCKGLERESDPRKEVSNQSPEQAPGHCGESGEERMPEASFAVSNRKKELMNWPQKGTESTKEAASFFAFHAFLYGNTFLAPLLLALAEGGRERRGRPRKSLIFMIFLDIFTVRLVSRICG